METKYSLRLERKLVQILKDPGPRTFNQLGILLYAADLDLAGKCFQRAHQLSPQDTDILYNYGEVLSAQYRWTKALDIYLAYLEICPQDSAVWSKLGRCYYNQGEYALAAQSFAQAREGRGNDQAANPMRLDLE